MRQDRRLKHIAAFVSQRTPQSDAEFIAACAVAPHDHDVAIAVRQSVARSCGVHPAYIRATDGFSRELYLLWGEESLDSIEYWLDLQKRLGVSVSDRDAERIPHPFGGDRSVAGLVRGVAEVAGSGPRNGPRVE